MKKEEIEEWEWAWQDKLRKKMVEKQKQAEEKMLKHEEKLIQARIN